MTTRSALRIILPALLAAACRTMPAPAAGAPGNADNAAPAGPLVSTLSVQPGRDTVGFILQVTNTTRAPVALHFRSGQTTDFQVRNGGELIWTSFMGILFTQAERTETLAAGATRSWSATWRPGPGMQGRTLTATARLTSDTHPVERTAQFRTP